MKKILIQNRKENLWQGGDWLQMQQTATALENLGYEVKVNTEQFASKEDIEWADVIHTFSFSFPWTKYQIYLARKYKKPVVCSMIYAETDEHIDYKLQQIMLNELSCAIFQTEGELERAKRHLDTKKIPCVIVPNGIDPWWFKKSKSILLFQDFVLTVGRIEPIKGQLAVSRVCKELGIPYIMIGEEKNFEYSRQCQENGAIYKPHMDREQLKSYYRSAKVYIQPSKAETWGMCIDEAMSQGTPCILTDMCERNGDFIRCKFDDDLSIEKAIKEAWEKPRVEAHNLLTWTEVGQVISEIYAKIT